MKQPHLPQRTAAFAVGVELLACIKGNSKCCPLHHAAIHLSELWRATTRPRKGYLKVHVDISVVISLVLAIQNLTVPSCFASSQLLFSHTSHIVLLNVLYHVVNNHTNGYLHPRVHSFLLLRLWPYKVWGHNSVGESVAASTRGYSSVCACVRERDAREAKREYFWFVLSFICVDSEAEPCCRYTVKTGNGIFFPTTIFL